MRLIFELLCVFSFCCFQLSLISLFQFLLHFSVRSFCLGDGIKKGLGFRNFQRKCSRNGICLNEWPPYETNASTWIQHTDLNFCRHFTLRTLMTALIDSVESHRHDSWTPYLGPTCLSFICVSHYFLANSTYCHWCELHFLANSTHWYQTFILNMPIQHRDLLRPLFSMTVPIQHNDAIFLSIQHTDSQH